MKKRYLGSLYFLQYKEIFQKTSGRLLLSIVALFLLASINPSKVHAQGFTINEDFKGDTSPNVYVGGDAYLTSGINDPGNKLNDPEDDGWLRLTDAAAQKAGYAVIDQSFPTDLGFLLDLEFVTWGGGGADGFSFFLFDSRFTTGTPGPGEEAFEIGAPGDALGYSRRHGDPGVTGGYIGVGVDEWGSFGRTTGSKLGAFPSPRPNRSPNSIAIRGPYNVGPNADRYNYRFLGGTENMATVPGMPPSFTLDYKPAIAFRPDENTYYRRIILSIVPAPGNKYLVSMKIKTDSNGIFHNVLDPFLIDEAPPAELKLGFAASTGTVTHIHELRNVMITTPGGVRVHKKANKNRAYIGDEIKYTIDLFNQSDQDLTNLKLSDVLPADFQPTSIVFNDYGNPLNTATGYSPTDLSDVTVSLAALEYATFTVTGNVTGLPPGGILINTAHFHANGQVVDEDLTNDFSTDRTIIMLPMLSLEKSGIYVDANNDNRVNVGDEIQYSFRVENTGNMKLFDVSIDDPLLTVSGGPIELEIGEFDETTFTGTYQITQADIDNGGVYNLATAEGKDRFDTEATSTSVDPNPLDPNDPNYDPARPNHTFVPLEVGTSLMITNPNIYQKVIGN